MISIVACLAGMYMVLSYGGSLILMILKAFQAPLCCTADRFLLKK